MAAPEERLTIDTGSTQVSGAFARPGRAFAAIVVAHGAGSGMDHPFLVGFCRAINGLGVATLRFNFPYMERGRRSPDSEPVALAAWRAAFDAAQGRAGKTPVFAGGKSYGGRMASMAVADGMPAAGLVFLGYPLHPPGKPDRIRDEHLYTIAIPMLFLQGTGDPFARADLLGAVTKRIGALATYVPVHGADHSFNVRGAKRDAREVGASLAEPAANFMRTVVG